MKSKIMHHGIGYFCSLGLHIKKQWKQLLSLQIHIIHMLLPHTRVIVQLSHDKQFNITVFYW